MFIKFNMFIFLFSLSCDLFGAEVLTHTGKVTQVVAFPHSYGSYNESVKGRLTIYVEGLERACNNGHPRVVIGADHPIHDSILSIALLAKASQKEVTVAYFNECTVRSQSWDLAYIAIN